MSMISHTNKKKKLPKEYDEEKLKELGIFIKNNEYITNGKKENQDQTK